MKKITEKEIAKDKMFQAYKQKFVKRVAENSGWYFDLKGNPLGSSEVELYDHFLKMKETAIKQLKSKSNDSNL
jgi:hypothetical protein